MHDQTTLKQFYWEGYTATGKKIRGQTTSQNTATAIHYLQQQGISVSKLINKKTPALFSYRQQITTTDIQLLLTNIATMLHAGLALAPTLTSIAQGSEKNSLLQLVLLLRQDITNGVTLADSLKKWPRYFSPLICQLIATGEQSGQLVLTLTQAANYLEKTAALKRKIAKTLFYPLTVFIIAILISLLLLIFMVPKFSAIYASYQTKLPLLTQLVCAVSASLIAAWPIWLLTAGSIILSSSLLVKRVHAWHRPLEFLLVKVTWLAKVYRKIIVMRVANILSILLMAGISIDHALLTAANSAGNYLYRQALLTAREHVLSGQRLSMSLAASGLFPPMTLQLIATSEQTAQLSEALARIAQTYHEQADSSLNSLCSLIEPLVMLLLGLMIGLLVIALYLPIFNLGTVF